MMTVHRNEMDVSLQIRVNNHLEVQAAVLTLYRDLFQTADAGVLEDAFSTAGRIYRGEDSRYHACDTWYHDLQHSLDVTLAMARLMDGHERFRAGGDALNERWFQLGVVAALFHDIGYIRRRRDYKRRHGAEYTLVHVARSAHFVRAYLEKTCLADDAGIGATLVRFTDHGKPLPPSATSGGVPGLLGRMVGAADFLAQMADRCYLEKCYRRLYPEFAMAGMAGDHEHALFSSAEDMLFRTPGFFGFVSRRLEHDLGGVHAFAGNHFGGDNLYLDAIERNRNFAWQVAEAGETSLLRRQLPDNAIPQPLLN